MLGNFLTVAIRHVFRNKIYSFINVAGLAVGMVGFILILDYVRLERSYDDFHDRANEIYRVQLDQYKDNQLIFKSSENYPAVGPALVRELPEVVDFARLYNLGSKNNVIITYREAPGGPIGFKHRRFLYADSSFLPMFSYPMILGDPAKALAEPFSMVISESYAKKYFGDENPIGKFLLMRDDDFANELCKVTGVVADPPINTHLKFDVLISYTTLYTRWDKAVERYDRNWQRKDMYTYIRVKTGTDPNELEAKFAGLIDKYMPDLKKTNRHDELHLQPLRDIHLYSNLTDEAEPNGNGDAVRFLLVIAFLIIGIAWINYINLSTARSVERSGEVGVRKVMGADRGQLRRQFLIESLLVNAVAFVLAVAVVVLTLPTFNRLTGLNLSLQIFSEWWFWPFVVALWIVGSIVSGLYPAMILSSFEPITMLKGKFKNSRRGVFLRKALVVLQYASSVALLAGTYVVYEQMHFMQNQNLGLSIEQTLVVERPGVVEERKNRGSQIEAFKNDCLKHPDVTAVAGSGVLPGKKLRFKAPIRTYTGSKESAVPIALAYVDFDFVKAMDVQMIAGRAFSREFPVDPDTSVILTRAGARALGFHDPNDAVGKTLAVDDFKWNPIVVGVMEDYHHESLKEEIQPTIFACWPNAVEYIAVKVKSRDVGGTVAAVEEAWYRNFPGNPFEYFFLDDYFNAQYRNEQRFGKMFAGFAALAIFVGSLGLFGLSSFTSLQRTKEIAVRKVLGADVTNLVLLLTRDYLLLIGVAMLLAWPVMFSVMSSWLEGFAYRIPLGWHVFVLSGTAVLITAVLTVSFQTIRAATANPVTALKYE